MPELTSSSSTRFRRTRFSNDTSVDSSPSPVKGFSQKITGDITTRLVSRSRRYQKRKAAGLLRHQRKKRQSQSTTALLSNDDEQQKKAALRLQQDPVWACETVLGATSLWQKQKEILESVLKNRRTAVRSCHSGGKALALDTPIPTPYGWTTMEEIEEGDVIYDEQGEECEVLTTSEIFEDKNCYEVEFSDGSTLVCSGDHQWNVLDFSTRSRLKKTPSGHRLQSLDWRELWWYSRTVDTQELFKNCFTDWDQQNWIVPCAKPLVGRDLSIPNYIPPYTLGAWLGDGTSSSGGFSAGKEDVSTILGEITKEGILVRERPASVRGTTSCGSYLLEGLVGRLRGLGVLGNKHIPDAYLRASVDIRLALLQGIMDTDGFGRKGSNAVGIDLTCKRLAMAVAELARTFGWKVSVRERRAKLYGRDCGPKWKIGFRPDLPVFRLQRKLDIFEDDRQQSVRNTARTVVDVRPIDTVATKCIAVSSKSNLYLAGESFIPTHNTYVAARACVWFLLTHPDSIVVTTAPTIRQVRKILWQEIRRCRTQMKIASKTAPLVQEWMIRDGWFAVGFATDDPDSFQGLHSASGYILITLDEASGVPKPIWDAIDGSLSSEQARLLSIGNPTNPVGMFHDEFVHPHTHKIAISAFDTPNFTTFGISLDTIRKNRWKKKVNGRELPYPSLVTPMWVREKWETWGESSPMWKSRVLGEFPEEAEDVLIPLTWVEQARQRYEQWEEEEDPFKKDLVPLIPIELGVDVARFGRNETVISLRRGSIVKVYKTWYGKSTMETVGRIVQARRDTGATNIKVDDGGVGGGVVDRLKELQEPVEAINSGSRPKDSEHFLNLRAEMWWNGRELLRKGEVLLVGDETLEGQLSAPKYGYDSKGRIKVESKDEMEGRGIQSPDRADSVLLALVPSKRRKGPICW